MANEEAPYRVVHKTEVYEIRHYLDRLVVETIKTDNNKSFRKLFNYIAGENNNGTKIEMTVPVTQIKKDNKELMQFFLPSKFTKDSVPIPNNPEIEITIVSEGYFAVIQYSGRLTERNFIKHVKILKKNLQDDKILISGSPIRASYNSPFTIPSFRRNEVMLNVDWIN